jgi:hypothetical protein
LNRVQINNGNNEEIDKYRYKNNGNTGNDRNKSHAPKQNKKHCGEKLKISWDPLKINSWIDEATPLAIA